jgi:hypothetical protein
MWFALYLAAAYLLIWGGVAVGRAAGKKWPALGLRLGGRSRAWLRAWLLAGPFVPHACVELDTLVTLPYLAAELRRAVRSEFPMEQVLSSKVLRFPGPSLRVYVVLRSAPAFGGARSAVVLSFARERGVWVYTGNWDAVWAEAGSASGTVFPPYPDYL